LVWPRLIKQFKFLYFAISLPISRRAYVDMYRPTTRDQVRLGDTGRLIAVERATTACAARNVKAAKARAAVREGR
jgi:urease alpha subunit